MNPLVTGPPSFFIVFPKRPAISSRPVRSRARGKHLTEGAQEPLFGRPVHNSEDGAGKGSEEFILERSAKIAGDAQRVVTERTTSPRADGFDSSKWDNITRIS